ncbi:MAG: hypothetical protein M1840_005763 [Geoglossum simile]|nr:MAG: hypothetical protein M1840_005763 [Geoglossum simile]
MRVEEMEHELTSLLERNQQMKVTTEGLLEHLQQVDDLEDLMKWHETERSMTKVHNGLQKICENSYAAIRGCVEDLHGLELAVEMGEPESSINWHAQHAMWNTACSFKGLQQAHSEPSLLSSPGRPMLNAYLEKTVRLGALLLDIHGYGDWANSWREAIEGGNINTISFDPTKPPTETNVRDTSLYAILNPLSDTLRVNLPFGIAAGSRYTDATMTIIHPRQGSIPDWNTGALRESPKVMEMCETFNAQAAHPESILGEGSFNMGWGGGTDWLLGANM